MKHERSLQANEAEAEHNKTVRGEHLPLLPISGNKVPQYGYRAVNRSQNPVALRPRERRCPCASGPKVDQPTRLSCRDCLSTLSKARLRGAFRTTAFVMAIQFARDIFEVTFMRDRIEMRVVFVHSPATGYPLAHVPRQWHVRRDIPNGSKLFIVFQTNSQILLTLLLDLDEHAIRTYHRRVGFSLDLS